MEPKLPFALSSASPSLEGVTMKPNESTQEEQTKQAWKQEDEPKHQQGEPESAYDEDINQPQDTTQPKKDGPAETWPGIRNTEKATDEGTYTTTPTAALHPSAQDDEEENEEKLELENTQLTGTQSLKKPHPQTGPRPGPVEDEMAAAEQPIRGTGGSRDGIGYPDSHPPLGPQEVRETEGEP
jgi:hypothetical protein